MPRIQTVVRIRPLIKQEESLPDSLLLQDRNLEIVVGEQTRSFTFDQLFDQATTQTELHEGLQLGKQIELFLQGFSQTIFAYGQTGSGKTYTIEGRPTEPGIIPSLITRIFTEVEQAKEHHHELSISFLQIYNEKVYDMLNFCKEQLKLRFRNDEFQAENLTSVSCNSAKSIMQCYAQGCKNKIMASHLLNESSSRSHCIFTIKLQKTNLTTNETLISNFHVVDLAGSERAYQSQAQGKHFLECTEINKSLFTLRQVISQLAKKGTHVPYRNSKLTSLLKSSLQGNSYVTMVLITNPLIKIVCISAAKDNLTQTLQSLTYGAKARTIHIEPKLQKDIKSQQLESLRAQVNKLQHQLQLANQEISTQTVIIEQLRRNSDTAVGDSDSKLLPQHPLRVNNFTVDKPNYMDQLTNQNTYIQTLLASEQRLQEEIQHCKSGLFERLQEIAMLCDENQSLRDKIQIFEDIIYQDLQNSKENDTFKKDWKELFEQHESRSSLIETITSIILNYKKALADQQKRMTDAVREASVNRSTDVTSIYSKQSVQSRRTTMGLPRPHRAASGDKRLLY